MAGPFHDYLRRDTAGKGKADEGTTAGMGAYHFALGLCLLYTLSPFVGNSGDGLVEANILADLLQVTVHQLVGQHRQRQIVREVEIFVLLQNFLGELVQVDGKPVVSLDSRNVHSVPIDIRPLKVSHIGITEAGECAEAEAVPGLSKTTGILYCCLILLTIHIDELQLGAVLGNLVVVQAKQFLLGQEDDGLIRELELGPVALDCILRGVALPERSVHEPAQVVELLGHALLLQVQVTKVDDELVDAGLVEEFELHLGIERFHVMLEGLPALVRGIGPAVGRAFLIGEFIQAVKEAYALHPHRHFLHRRLLIHRLLQLLPDLVRAGLFLQRPLPFGEVHPHFIKDIVDVFTRLPLDILVVNGRLSSAFFIPLLDCFFSRPVGVFNGHSGGGNELHTLDRKGCPDGAFSGSYAGPFFQVKFNCHNYRTLKSYAESYAENFIYASKLKEIDIHSKWCI